MHGVSFTSFFLMFLIVMDMVPMVESSTVWGDHL